MNTTAQIEQEERKNRSVALGVTTVIYVLLFLLLWFVGMWKLTPPPEPMVGIELANLGNGVLGSGDIQTHNKPSRLPNREESKPAKEEVREERTVRKPEVKEVVPVKKPVVKAPEAPLKTAKTESPVKVAPKPEPKETKPVETKVSAPAKPAEKPVEQPKVDTKGLYGKAKSNGTNGTSDNPGGNNNGPAGNKGVGDYGSPDGKVDGRGLYGKGTGGGGGNGSSLSLTGWTWSRRPSPQGLTSDGKVVFRIKIDENGNLISKSVVESTLSPADVRKCEREIERLDFVPTNASGSRAAQSSGTITFVVRSQ
ncbi:hypothetical protein BWI93_09010 [Siphonobacter sp. BAB-5385]|uniref:Energy transducer TonB n=1 Tax=Siphonobacter curvatus TaxID=2094562 RepID=A0A2S7IPZ4_9BACT|nr:MULTISPECIES: hypothetical protein [Siphonobacter]OZI08523.1 hypothetical protein BWI93_09010 [Siphonobacter sp. BAB-5385]PMD99092.1 hypothetical protein BWI97_01390 [Siphonobacter sp. BAB-5405]PQA59784.1 hypothetical protein C5O19_09210 [Siphonobacter curvatus]